MNEADNLTIKEIGKIGNHYGSLNITTENGKYYWSIENWDGHSWEEIPEYLYQALIKFEEVRKS